MKRLIPILCALILLASSIAPLSVQAQKGTSVADPSQAQAAALLENLTPEERVAQLFLVTYKGVDVSQTSQIYDLIYKHHIGGVVLLSKNDNFVSSGITISEAYRVISSLQNTEWAASQQYAAEPVNDDLEEQEMVFLSLDEIDTALSKGEFKILSWTALISLSLRYLKKENLLSFL